MKNFSPDCQTDRQTKPVDQSINARRLVNSHLSTSLPSPTTPPSCCTVTLEGISLLIATSHHTFRMPINSKFYEHLGVQFRLDEMHVDFKTQCASSCHFDDLLRSLKAGKHSIVSPSEFSLLQAIIENGLTGNLNNNHSPTCKIENVMINCEFSLPHLILHVVYSRQLQTVAYRNQNFSVYVYHIYITNLCFESREWPGW